MHSCMWQGSLGFHLNSFPKLFHGSIEIYKKHNILPSSEYKTLINKRLIYIKDSQLYHHKKII